MISKFGMAALCLIIACACTSKIESDSKPKDSLAELPASFGLGRMATQHEIDSLDIDVRPDGIGLPKGSGSVDQGRLLYSTRCAMCHGRTGVEGPNEMLVAVITDSLPKTHKAIGNYWPYATTLYDYIHRAMPFHEPGSLTPDEVYSLTAFLLHRNEIVDASFIANEKNLSTINMPAKKLFVEDDGQGGIVKK